MNLNTDQDNIKLNKDAMVNQRTNKNMSQNSNPFMRKTPVKSFKKDPEKEKSSRWANLDFSEPEQSNRFISHNNDHDTFRKSDGGFSRDTRHQTSRNFRRGETFNYSLQYEEGSSRKPGTSGFKGSGGSNFMKFTKPRPPTPPPEFNLDKMEEDFPTLA